MTKRARLRQSTSGTSNRGATTVMSSHSETPNTSRCTHSLTTMDCSNGSAGSRRSAPSSMRIGRSMAMSSSSRSQQRRAIPPGEWDATPGGAVPRRSESTRDHRRADDHPRTVRGRDVAAPGERCRRKSDWTRARPRRLARTNLTCTSCEAGACEPALRRSDVEGMTIALTTLNRELRLYRYC
jgi:hypothetical protein